jgi:hypothetical protein
MAALVCLQVNGGSQLTEVGQGKKQLLFASLPQAVDKSNVARWDNHSLLHLHKQVF